MLSGLDSGKPVDAILVNSPLKNYDVAPRVNDYTLPVLGLGYIATFAKHKGFNLGVLDVESLGIGVRAAAELINTTRPRWVGLNLLAPTYELSKQILERLSPDIRVALGGHQAKAMPLEILKDARIPRIDALVLGEGEMRFAALLQDQTARENLPGVWYRDRLGTPKCSSPPNGGDPLPWTAPDINQLPFLDREFLVQDPFRNERGELESNMVGSRGCPYDCSFCGAAISANPDIAIRTREPENILDEMERLAATGVTAFRFVDDLFLASPGFMRKCLPLFVARSVGERFSWDATGRINTLSRADAGLLDTMKLSGCREVALGVESGSERVLRYIGKKTTPEMTLRAIDRLTKRGINVKGYIILGFPGETRKELQETVAHVARLWEISARNPGSFRCSVFEFRPYPGTPEWHRLIASGKYTPEQLLDYHHVDLTNEGADELMAERDEFNFSVNIQFGEAGLGEIRAALRKLNSEQKIRTSMVQ